MRVVIDSNRLQSDELRLFLRTSPDNKAVLTDYAWMEAYKGDSVRSITKSMAVLADFPEQVVILRGTKAVGALDARAPGLADRMIWPRSGKEFAKTVEGLRKAAEGDPGVIAQILHHGNAAEEQMAKILADASALVPVLAETAKLFTVEEVRRFRTGKSYAPATGRKIFTIADELCRGLLERHPGNPRKPTRSSLVNTFLYRYSLSSTLYLLEWIREGSQMAKRPDKIRNDLVDLNFATFGTYFNGLMTADAGLRGRYGELRHVLGIRGARMPGEFLGPFLDQLKLAPVGPGLPMPEATSSAS